MSLDNVLANVKDFVTIIGVLLPVVATMFAVAAAAWSSVKRVSKQDGEADKAIFGTLVQHHAGDSPELSRRQFALLQQYHTQGLAQSKISFWFSLIFASLGFSVIMVGVGLFMSQDASQELSIASLQKPGFTLISGTVIDAVAALFFVQSNRARQLMTEFFDKLRVDRKLDEALKFANEIADPKIQSSLKAVLALSFAEVKSPEGMLASILGASPLPITPGLTVVSGGVETTKAAPAGQ